MIRVFGRRMESQSQKLCPGEKPIHHGNVFIKLLLLITFVLAFFVFIAVYTYVFARVQNSTLFFKFLDVINLPLVSQIISFVWFLSVPILLVIFYIVFFKIWFKRFFLKLSIGMDCGVS